jgi:hypothetical protein
MTGRERPDRDGCPEPSQPVGLCHGIAKARAVIQPRKQSMPMAIIPQSRRAYEARREMEYTARVTNEILA